MITKFKNKRGASLFSWTEIGVGVILIVACLVIIVGSMNQSYNKNYDGSFGIATNGTLEDFKGYQGTLQTGMSGEATTNAINGVNVASSWGVIKAGLNMAFNIVTGNWINNAIGLLHLGTAGDWLAMGLRLLFIFSIGFILIKILFKISP